jgi:hypothetical protein
MGERLERRMAPCKHDIKDSRVTPKGLCCFSVQKVGKPDLVDARPADDGARPPFFFILHALAF